jgi:hypothetical protein
MSDPVIDIKVGLLKNGRRRSTIKTASPIVRKLCEVMDERCISSLEMAAQLGISTNCFGRWRYGQSTPSIYLVELWAEALGFTFNLVENDERPRQERVQEGDSQPEPAQS